MIDRQDFIRSIELVKSTSPIVHNITNYVAMNFTANALLAFGASPIMAHAHEEVEELVNIASASVINIGTIDGYWLRGMMSAAKAADEKNKPWVLDPVGAGATTYRTQNALRLIQNFHPSVIRGNASEIMALAGMNIKSKGVDSSHESPKALDSAISLAKKYKTIVVISGETDYITDGNITEIINNGSPLMPRITAMGCTASSMIGAFLSVTNNHINAATYAMAVMAIAGELTAKQVDSPGSFAPLFIDNLYKTTSLDFSKNIRQ